jgi:SAM-dependent methyltransferase
MKRSPSRPLSIENPKLRKPLDADIYPYYAGFSPEFADVLMLSARLKTGAHVLDPWNGSGTVTRSAVHLGHKACGFDLNPAMAIVAKGKALSRAEAPSLGPICADITAKALNAGAGSSNDADPLSIWLSRTTTISIRRIEKAIQLLLVDAVSYLPLHVRDNYAELSDLACFFYIALFRTVKLLLRPFASSNPTWVRKPKKGEVGVEVSMFAVLNLFTIEVKKMIEVLTCSKYGLADNSAMKIDVASSEALPLHGESVDFVLSSPPYCTRIDYAVATLPELAILGYGTREFDELRRRLIGTPTVSSTASPPSNKWGETCNRFLDAVRHHGSKASFSYYYKNHVQYFHGIHDSIKEISRVLKSKGTCVLVVQDSYYKNVHNDLPQVLIEMADTKGLILTARSDFPIKNSMAGINPRARLYRNRPSAVESVLCFTKSKEDESDVPRPDGATVNL